MNGNSCDQVWTSYSGPSEAWIASLREIEDEGWLRLERETFDRLYAYKRRGGHLTFDAALIDLLDMRAKEVVP